MHPHMSLNTLLEDATDSNSWDNEYETALMEWHRLCVAGLAGVSCTCNAWLLLAGAASGQSYTNESDKDPSAPHSESQHSSGQRKCKRKFNESEQSVLEKASDKILLGMEKMCTAIMTSAKQLSRIDGDRNVKIFEELKALDLRRPYLIRCYIYLCDTPSAASAFLSLPEDFREEMLLHQVGGDTDTP